MSVNAAICERVQLAFTRIADHWAKARSVSELAEPFTVYVHPDTHAAMMRDSAWPNPGDFIRHTIFGLDLRPDEQVEPGTVELRWVVKV